ncbi:MAG: hypothetical protein JWQ85_3288 [Mucilaginibacter sp.]|nr:hypothetical protein [Mucilaginibacter sp.]
MKAPVVLQPGLFVGLFIRCYRGSLTTLHCEVRKQPTVGGAH